MVERRRRSQQNIISHDLPLRILHATISTTEACRASCSEHSLYTAYGIGIQEMYEQERGVECTTEPTEVTIYDNKSYDPRHRRPRAIENCTLGSFSRQHKEFCIGGLDER